MSGRAKWCMYAWMNPEKRTCLEMNRGPERGMCEWCHDERKGLHAKPVSAEDAAAIAMVRKLLRQRADELGVSVADLATEYLPVLQERVRAARMFA